MIVCYRMTRLLALIAVVLCLCACATEGERYQRNARQVQVGKNVRLPQSEIDEIVRAVSRESMFPILYISRWKSERGDDIAVYTDLSHGPQRYMVYHVTKQADGQWHIFRHAEGSVIFGDIR